MGRSSIGPGIIVMFCGFAGVIMAFIEKVEYDNGVLVAALASMNITLAEAMTVTVILWLLFGCILAAVKS